MRSRNISRRGFFATLAAGCGVGAMGGLRGCSSLKGRRADDPTTELDLRDAARAVRDRSLSPVELTQACLERIERLDPQLNAFITVTPERAMDEARRAEDSIANGGWRGPLHGIPIAIKDNIDTAGVRTTAASGLFADRVPTEDAGVVQRLRSAGAVLLGKLNMHEFALGTTSAISHFGPVRNPWDLERSAGGSSGGSGAAVAGRLCFGALGTDTGGSVRIPAACCGVVGFKPTHGVVSTAGTIPVAPSFDDVGPLCRTVADAALMLRAMTDHQVAAAYDVASPPPVAALRVGLVREPSVLCDGETLEPEIQAALEDAVEVIRSLVAEVRDVDLAMPEHLGAVIDAEAYALHAPYLATAAPYDPRTRSTIVAGETISQTEYARLRQELDRHRAGAREAFADVDVVLLPTLPRLPPLLRDATEPFALPACTFAFSIAGLPAISVPCGLSSARLPIGLLIGGPPYRDGDVLALAQAYEHATGWHRLRPPV